MFKNFSIKEDVSGQAKLKSSAQRALRAKLLEQYPALLRPVNDGQQEQEQEKQEQDQDQQQEVTTVIDCIWPKKEEVHHVKCRDKMAIYTLNKIPLFFQSDDGPFYLSLHLLQKFPEMLPKVQVDRGAIKFVLSGANIMCPGLTSAGGYLPEQSIPPDTPVAIFAQGKEHPCAIGITKLSTDEIKSVNKGIGIDNVHYLGDDLWSIKEF